MKTIDALIDFFDRLATPRMTDAQIEIIEKKLLNLAIDQLHEALRLNPNSAPAHANLGLALLASGKPRESIPEFEAALRLRPELKAAADNLRRAQAQLNSQR